jgi:hypothetical protein
MTPIKFIENAWVFDFAVNSADAAKLDANFIADLKLLAETDDIDVRHIDFSCYSCAAEALNAKENTLFLASLNNEPTKKTLLILENCDLLAPLNEDITFTLREILTTRISGMTQSIFTARSESLESLFHDTRAAFYQSNYSITR